MKRPDLPDIGWWGSAVPACRVRAAVHQGPTDCISVTAGASRIPCGVQAGPCRFWIYRWANLSCFAPATTDLPEFAAKAVAAKPDIILAAAGLAAPPAEAATMTIPIVFAAVSDPLGIGLVTNLAPGGNLTGNSQVSPDLVGKQMAIIKGAMPFAEAACASELTDQSAQRGTDGAGHGCRNDFERRACCC